MRRKLCKWLLEKWFGFTDETHTPWPSKCIIALAPHTSNWDFIIGITYMWAHGYTCNFLMKSEWFFWPCGVMMRSLGGIPVRRSRNHSMTDQLAQKAREMDSFHLCITPEGTRRATSEWRKGFFYIAQKAGIPILVYGLDFKTMTLVECGIVSPTPDSDADATLKEIKTMFRGMEGKKPGQFTTD